MYVYHTYTFLCNYEGENKNNTRWYMNKLKQYSYLCEHNISLVHVLSSTIGK